MSGARTYYNEIDPYAAQWIRNLIASGLVSAGDVDERDIRDVRPSDLAGYTRCHFFAGIAVWDYALNLAGWPAERPAWTASTPCPPFSSAGKGQRCPECSSARNLCHPRKTGHFVCLDCGCDRHADDRHLYPEFGRLVRECRPPKIFGEQVASSDGRLWLAAVRADLEAMGYGVGAADLCAAGLGAPHIRQRLWFMADAGRERCQREPACVWRAAAQGRVAAHHSEAARRREDGDAADASCERRHGQQTIAERGGVPRPEDGRLLGHAFGTGFPVGSVSDDECRSVRLEGAAAGATGSVRDPWRGAERIECSDGRWRPAEPGTFPLAHGASARVGRLRAYGNAIVPQAAAAFIGAALEALPLFAAE